MKVGGRPGGTEVVSVQERTSRFDGRRRLDISTDELQPADVSPPGRHVHKVLRNV